MDEKIKENPLAMKSGDIFPKRYTKLHRTMADSLNCPDCISARFLSKEKELLSRIKELEEAIEKHKIGLDTVWNENIHLEDLFPNIHKVNKELYKVLKGV